MDKKRKSMNDKTIQGDTELDSQTFKIKMFLVIYNRQTKCRTKKMNNYLWTSVWKYFFIFNITNLTSSEIHKNSEKLQKYYLNDLAFTFANEYVHFRSFLC